MTVFDFDEQHMRGWKGEAFLDRFFRARGHIVQKATRGQQRQGIDRVLIFDEKLATVEYKTDFIAHKTGCVFIETVSVDSDHKAGWAFTSMADLLVYFIPGIRCLYVIPFKYLRDLLEEWKTTYPTRSAQNDGYATHGVLVPIAAFALSASQVFNVTPSDDQ
jgi:hypothetical protein